MRAVLQAISEELLRLRADGESVVSVSEETLVGLRALVARQQEPAGEARSSGDRAKETPETKSGNAQRDEPAAWRPARTAPDKPTAPLAPQSLVPPVANAFKVPPPPAVVLPEGDAMARLAALADLLRSDPVARHYLREDQKAVIGAGVLTPRILFIGDELTSGDEGGADPFVGAAAESLSKMIRAMGLEPAAVYVANLVPWRLPIDPSTSLGATEKRPVSTAELSYALPYVRAAVDQIKPSLVVGLGLAAAQALLAAKVTKLPDVRSLWHDLDGRPLMITYHPAYVLQNGTNKSKRAVWEDLMKVMERAHVPITEKQQRYFLT